MIKEIKTNSIIHKAHKQHRIQTNNPDYLLALFVSSLFLLNYPNTPVISTREHSPWPCFFVS